MDDTGFGPALRTLRTQRGLSLRALAGRVHYSKGYLSRVENGERPATAQLARQCDEVLAAQGTLASLVPQAGRPRRAWRPAQMPGSAAHFTGRGAALGWLDDRSGTHTVMVLSGPPGVGKTAVALRWAELAAERFPDGELFADLHGHDAQGLPADPGDLLDGFLRALGVAAQSIPGGLWQRSALLRTVVRGKRILLVLDNAATPDQVRPLLPGTGACRVLVTSRAQLRGLSAREGAARLVLDPLAEDEALDLLAKSLDDHRVPAEPGPALAIVQSCGCLPLALRIAGERAQTWPRLTLAALAAQLAARSDRLDLLTIDDDESVAVRAVFSWSYRTLPARMATMFRLLSLHPGHDIGVPAAAAVAAVTAPQARLMLYELSASSLIEACDPDRYRFHDLIRLYARERADAEEAARDTAAAAARLVRWYLHTAAAADRLIAPQHPHPDTGPPDDLSPAGIFDRYEQALEWFDLEHANLAAITKMAAEAGGPGSAWHIPAICWSYLKLRKPWAEWLPSCQAALDAARRAGDQAGEAWMLTVLSAASFDLDRAEAALEHAEAALEIRRRLGDRRGECGSMHNLGIICRRLDQNETAIAWSQRALALSRELGDVRGTSAALNHIGEIYRETNDPRRSVGYYHEAVELCRQAGDTYGEACVLDNLGSVMLSLGSSDTALGLLERALRVRREIGDRHGETETLIHLADLHVAAGDAECARDLRRQALAICEDRGDPRAESLRRAGDGSAYNGGA